MLTEAMKKLIDALGDNWMVRTSNQGKAYGGFQWQRKGEETTAPDWNDSATCGGGLHGQGPGGYGYHHCGDTFEFCETRGKRLCIEGNKIKVQHATILWTGQAAYDALAYACGGNFPGNLRITGKITCLLTTCANVYVSGKFDAPLLTTCANVSVSGKFDAPMLTTCANVDVYGKFDAPLLTTCANVDVYGKFDAPLLTKKGKTP